MSDETGKDRLEERSTLKMRTKITSTGRAVILVLTEASVTRVSTDSSLIYMKASSCRASKGVRTERVCVWNPWGSETAQKLPLIMTHVCVS